MDNLYTFRLDKWQVALTSSVTCLIFFTMGIGGYLLKGDSTEDHHAFYAQVLSTWEQHLETQAGEVMRVKQQASAQLEALTKRVAELQAQLYHIDGISQRLVQVAQLDPRELIVYNISASVPWNHRVDTPSRITSTDFIISLDKLEAQILTRSQQLAVLEKLLLERQLTESMLGLTRIVDQGWISSPYGYRVDPITQEQAWHDGIDIAAELGTPIKAIAPGIVRFAGMRAGFGHLIEIDHGNGFITRYAHNRNNLVVMGDIVNKGQMVAQMGNSGRATGPHVHFEMLRNGTTLNPLPYIQAGYGITPQ